MSQEKNPNPTKKPGLIKRLWQWLRRPSGMALGSLLLIGFLGGFIFVVGFNTSMTEMNSEEFCLGCHEMRDNVYQEYIETAHFSNRSGFKATCSDCHVPHEFVPKMIRKIKASKELYGKVTGLIDTPQKFNEHRLAMALNEWERMKANDSQECRNCHKMDNMDFLAQKTVAADMHREAIDLEKTCIDCHKGIAHRLPDMSGIPSGLTENPAF